MIMNPREMKQYGPLKGKQAYFVAGLPSINELETKLDQHVGYADPERNVTALAFAITSANNQPWEEWEKTIIHFLKCGWWVMLSFPPDCVELVLECGFNEYQNFVAKIDVKVPYIDQFNYNAMVSINDIEGGFNPGVWDHYLHDLMSRNNFTPRGK